VSGGLLLSNNLLANQLLSNSLCLFFTKADFGKTFKWGVAQASYQTEGAWNIEEMRY